MQPYRWSCAACSNGNERECDICSRCQCPASATYAQIAAAKSAAGIVEPCEGPTGQELFGLVINPFRRNTSSASSDIVAEIGMYGILWVALKACVG